MRKELTVPAREEEIHSKSPEHAEHGEEEQEVYLLKRELDAVTGENQALKAEVSGFEGRGEWL